MMTQDEFNDWADKVLKKYGIDPKQSLSSSNAENENRVRLILHDKYFEGRHDTPAHATMVMKENAELNEKITAYINLFRVQKCKILYPERRQNPILSTFYLAWIKGVFTVRGIEYIVFLIYYHCAE